MQACKSAQQILTNWNFTGTSIQNLFIPRSHLVKTQIISRKSVRKILGCHNGDCDSCKADYRFICSGRQIRIQTEENIERILASAILLFALLIRIGHPLLIIPLLEHKRKDANTLDTYCAGSFEFPKIQEKYWEECRRPRNEDTEAFSKEIAVLIQQHISIFFRPSFGDDKFQVIDPKLLLPIYGEHNIGQGSFGKVIAFKIFDGHNKLAVGTQSMNRAAQLSNKQDYQDTRGFARKVLSCKEYAGLTDGHKEGQILSKVNALKNDHLVRIVTSFTYGDEFNIVFRRMTTNLERALRDPQYLLEQIVSPLRMCPLWPQMLGLAQALHEFSTGNWKHKLQSSESEETSLGEAERAIHFDLKPSNILVDRPSRTSPTFQLVITDFGLADIKKTQGGSSGTHDRGGDEEYAPYEIMLETQTRKYDVWSLGCIFLEIVTFLVAGHEGVTELDSARRQTSLNRRRQAHCYWEPCTGGGDGFDGYRLKESVRLFIDTLKSRAATIGRYTSFG